MASSGSPGDGKAAAPVSPRCVATSSAARGPPGRCLMHKMCDTSQVPTVRHATTNFASTDRATRTCGAKLTRLPGRLLQSTSDVVNGAIIGPGATPAISRESRHPKEGLLGGMGEDDCSCFYISSASIEGARLPRHDVGRQRVAGLYANLYDGGLASNSSVCSAAVSTAGIVSGDGVAKHTSHALASTVKRGTLAVRIDRVRQVDMGEEL
jgi:hypothetical protein